jgi:putative hydrolase of the HAD superfamily
MPSNGGQREPEASRPELISEAITPATGTADASAMSRGEPGLPAAFFWRGRTVRVAACLRGWKKHGRESGSDEIYLRRHYYELQMQDGSRWTVYCLRQPAGSSIRKRWFLYTVDRTKGTGAGSARRGASFQAVLFDLFHTLVLLQAAPGASTPEILGIEPSVWTETVFGHSPHHALGEVTDPYESIRRIAHRIDPAIPEETIRRAVEARPARFRHALTHVRPEILEGLAHLRELGLRMGVISNAAYDEIEAWNDSPLARLFDVVLFSCHEKVAKPDPVIYLRAADRLGIAAERSLFVGDGGSREHEGAREAGMSTVLILGLLREGLPEQAAKRRRDTDWVVEQFDELVALVRRLILS